MATDEILFTVRNKLGVITLNRPHALNSLTLNMIRQLKHHLSLWEKDKHIQAVFIHSNDARAFCAGGDIRAIYQAKQQGISDLGQFFREEYEVNTLIKNYPKPYIAFMHGITMGGGIGISIHGQFRIASDTLQFAMPETGIGFFPDVGGSYFLSRAPGHLGLYIALTGIRLNATDAHYANFVDYIIDTKHLDDFLEELVKSDTLSAEKITKLLDYKKPSITNSLLAQHRQHIDDCFSANTVEEILQRLEKLKSPWADTTIQQLKTKSPTSLKVTLQQIHQGAALPFNDCMKMEYAIACQFMQHHDFFEGVRALLIDKDQQPHWQPATLADATPTLVNSYFQM